MNKILCRLLYLQMVLLVLTLLYSWLGSLYGLPVQNLLAHEGIRWMMRNVMPNFAQMPVLSLLLLLIGWGMLTSSGWLKTCGCLFRSGLKRLPPRQRWGFQVSMIIMFAYLSLLATGFWGQEPVMLSVTGELWHSPFGEGFIFLLILGVLLVSGVYAWVSGTFRHASAFVSSMAAGISKGSILVLNTLLLGQQIGFLRYICY